MGAEIQQTHIEEKGPQLGGRGTSSKEGIGPWCTRTHVCAI